MAYAGQEGQGPYIIPVLGAEGPAVQEQDLVGVVPVGVVNHRRRDWYGFTVENFHILKQVMKWQKLYNKCHVTVVGKEWFNSTTLIHCVPATHW